MSEQEPEGPSRDELLDNTPEAVAMRRARAARARQAGPPEAAPRTSRRRLVVGGILAVLAAIRVLERAVRAGTGAGRR